jgi:C4-dicarboxylate-specific signal transduction histidine kinase
MSKPPNQDAKAPVAAAPTPDYGAAIVAARPKVKELLAEYRADPTGDAGTIVEALLLSQVAGAPARENEILAFQQERNLYRTLEHDSGRSATRLARQNRRLKSELAKRDDAQTHVREYLQAVARAGKGREPTPEEIIEKVSAAIGIRGPVIPRVETGEYAEAWNRAVGERNRE